MRKNLFLFAAATAVLASCSNDEMPLVNLGSPIEFRASVNSPTRASDITSSNMSAFNVSAIVHSDDESSTSYFDNVTFTKNDGGTYYESGTKYYWPVEALDFFAYSPTDLGSNQVTRTDYKTFTVTPAEEAASQIDLVFAHKANQTKSLNTTGVLLNFRHTEAKIAVKVKNTAPNLKFEVTGWRVGYVAKSGTFTYTGTGTDEHNSAQLASSCWSENTTTSADSYYTNSISSGIIVAAQVTNAQILGEAMILIPQNQNAATTYASSEKDAAVNGAYIGVELKIMNNTDANTVIHDKVWAIWPVKIDWTPGKSYTYTIDLAGGGYYETNVDGSDTGDDNLDPILENGVIKFVTVTVDDWSSVSDSELSGPTE